VAASVLSVSSRALLDACARQITVGLTAPLHPAVITRPYAKYTLAAAFLRMRIAMNQRIR